MTVLKRDARARHPHNREQTEETDEKRHTQEEFKSVL